MRLARELEETKAAAADAAEKGGAKIRALEEDLARAEKRLSEMSEDASEVKALEAAKSSLESELEERREPPPARAAEKGGAKMRKPREEIERLRREARGGARERRGDASPRGRARGVKSRATLAAPTESGARARAAADLEHTRNAPPRTGAAAGGDARATFDDAVRRKGAELVDMRAKLEAAVASAKSATRRSRLRRLRATRFAPKTRGARSLAAEERGARARDAEVSAAKASRGDAAAAAREREDALQGALKEAEARYERLANEAKAAEAKAAAAAKEGADEK